HRAGRLCLSHAQAGGVGSAGELSDLQNEIGGANRGGDAGGQKRGEMMRWGCLILAAIYLSGCATVPRDAGFVDVEKAVSARIDHGVRWNRSSPEDRQAAEIVRGMLARELSA